MIRILSTSLGAWDTIEADTKGTHGITFPLALVHAVLQDGGYPEPDSWEGAHRPPGPWGLALISAMDPRHFWGVPGFLRDIGCPVRSADRVESDPIVVLGGQAATAPAPVGPFVDLVYIGEAEVGLLAMMEALTSSGTRRQRLERAALVPGVWVPSVHPPGHVVVQQFAADISISLRHLTSVSLRKIHRVEIARGCASKCGFCVLGWRAPYRENDSAAIADALARSLDSGVTEVHLSAGDAEGHRGIQHIRETVADLGMRDHGWTGRLDTMRDCSVSAGKLFAFGIEGLSHRLRKALGKPRLTDDYIVQEMVAFWEAGGRRSMWHLIGGVPYECDDDAAEFTAMIHRLRREAPRDARLHLEIGRQPFGPMPHTPMQWYPPGLTTERVARAIAAAGRSSGALTLDEKSGQSEPAALVSLLAIRGGAEVAPLLEAGAPRLGGQPRKAWTDWVRSAGLNPYRYLGRWDVDAPTPWEWVESAFRKDSVKRGFRHIDHLLVG